MKLRVGHNEMFWLVVDILTDTCTRYALKCTRSFAGLWPAALPLHLTHADWLSLWRAATMIGCSYKWLSLWLAVVIITCRWLAWTMTGFWLANLTPGYAWQLFQWRKPPPSAPIRYAPQIFPRTHPGVGGGQTGVEPNVAQPPLLPQSALVYSTNQRTENGGCVTRNALFR